MHRRTSSVELPRFGRLELAILAGCRRVLSYGVPFGAMTRDVWLICLSNVIGAFGEGLYFWVFPLYITSLRADYVQLGTVLSALYFVAALAPIPGGFLADRFDRKKIMILSWAPWAVAPLIYSFAENWVQLIPGTVFWGVSVLGVPALMAYVITSVVDKGKLASVLSFVFAAYSFSYIFAPTFGAYLATVIGMRWVLRLSGALSAVSMAAFFFLRSQRPQRSEQITKQETSSSPEQRALWRKLLLWSAFFTATSFFMSLARPYIPTFLDEQVRMSEFHIGLFGSINFAGMTVLGIAMGRLGDRWRKSGAITLCLLLYTLSTVPFLMVSETSPLMLIAFFLGGSAVSGSLVSSYVGTIAPENKRGSWSAIPQTVSLLAAFVAPYLGGYLYTQSPYYAFIISASVAPFLGLLALVKLRE